MVLVQDCELSEDREYVLASVSSQGVVYCLHACFALNMCFLSE